MSNKKTGLFLSQKINFDQKHLDSPSPCNLAQTIDSKKGFTTTQETFISKSKSSYNIFDGIQSSNKLEINNTQRQKFVDTNIGPRTDSEGNIVRWSILGKPDQFTRVQKIKKVQINKPKKQNQDNSFDEEIAIAFQSGPMLKNQLSQNSEARLQNARKTPKKQRGDYKLVQKPDLINRMKEIKTRIEANELHENHKQNTYSLNIKNAMTREHKVMDNFDEQVDRWDFFNNQIASKCERRPQDTIFTRADQFKEKMQKIEMLEATKNDSEKFNDRQWYMRLRVYEHLEKQPPFTLITTNRPQTERYQTKNLNRYVKDPEAEHLTAQNQFILSDIYANFSTKIIDNPYEQVETVISNQTLGGLSPLFSKNMLAKFNTSFAGKNRKKFVDCKQFLLVEGQNQYLKEFEALKDMPFDQQFQLSQNQNEDAEVIKKKWNIRYLAKSNEHFYPKLVS